MKYGSAKWIGPKYNFLIHSIILVMKLIFLRIFLLYFFINNTKSSSSIYNKVYLYISTFVLGIVWNFMHEHSYSTIFCLVYGFLLKLCATNLARPCQLRPGLSFSLLNCIYKKLCII